MHTPANSLSGFQRRSGLDRRQGKISIFSKHSLIGRREEVRRQEDIQKPYEIDRHSHGTLLLILLVISLSILDASLTLFLIHNGASEVNPVMAYFLDHGPLVFFWAKYLITSCSLLFLLPYMNCYIFGTKVRAKTLFVLFAIPFALVVNWELYLIFFVL